MDKTLFECITVVPRMFPNLLIDPSNQNSEVTSGIMKIESALRQLKPTAEEAAGQL
jgi:hypothetical protein